MGKTWLPLCLVAMLFFEKSCAEPNWFFVLEFLECVGVNGSGTMDRPVLNAFVGVRHPNVFAVFFFHSRIKNGLDNSLCSCWGWNRMVNLMKLLGSYNLGIGRVMGLTINNVSDPRGRTFFSVIIIGIRLRLRNFHANHTYLLWKPHHTRNSFFRQLKTWQETISFGNKVCVQQTVYLRRLRNYNISEFELALFLVSWNNTITD